MKIAILGGRFDPPHIGHLLIVRQILEKRSDIKEVWLIPAGKHQWKKTEASAKHRLAMLQFFKSDRIKISDTELSRKGISYTIDTVREIKEKYNHSIYWIVGADIISEFQRWKKTEELINLATFIVFPRDPFALPIKLPKGFEEIRSKNLITTSLSSTIIRERIKKHLSITNLVPKEVEEYIKKHNLYA